MKRTLYPIAFLLLIVTTTIAGCGRKQNAVSSSAKPAATKVKPALTVAVMPTMACLPYLVAQRCQYYDSLKLPVRFVMYGSMTDAGQALSRQKVDAAYMDVFRAVMLHQSGTQVGIFTGYDSDLSLVVGRATRLRKLSQLNKRMVAIDRYSSADYMCDRAATMAGIDAEEVFRPQINDIALRASMVLNNQIEAAVLPQPWALALGMRGCHTLLNTRQWGQSYDVLVTPQKGYQEKRPLLIKLHEGYFMALKSLKQNPHLADSVLLATYHLPRPVVDSLAKGKLKTPAQIDARMLTVAHDWLKQRGATGSSKRGLPALLK